MKKLFLSLLMLCGMCITLNAQTPYKVLKVHKGGEVTHTHKLSDIDSLMVETVGETPDDLNGHEYVDLGLPSGTLWAICNVGATSPADYGDYFAWGETNPKEDYSWSTYKWCNGSSKVTKYNSVDNKIVLDPSDDAATANWGTGWRMPTSREQQELRNTNYCTWIWTTKANSRGETVYGCEVTSKSNGNSLFLPAAGLRDGTSLHGDGHNWSSSLYSDIPSCAYRLGFNSGSSYQGICDRSYGQPVRPVRASARN